MHFLEEMFAESRKPNDALKTGIISKHIKWGSDVDDSFRRYLKILKEYWKKNVEF